MSEGLILEKMVGVDRNKKVRIFLTDDLKRDM
jgi:hypothetical protein